MRFLLVLVMVLAACDLEDDLEVGVDESALFHPNGSLRWLTDPWSGETRIPVCWLQSGWGLEKGWVRSAVQSSWGAYSTVVFTGWDTCSSTTPTEAIRIQIEDSQPRSFIGRRSGSPTMYLNFTFHNWMTRNDPFFKPGGLISNCEDLDPGYCIRGIAIHEFGHALGFAHEQDHPGNLGQCTEDVVDYGGGLVLTTYDPQSVMNYCASTWSAQSLSARDIAGIQGLYGVLRGPGAAILDHERRLTYLGVDETAGYLKLRRQSVPNGGWTGWTGLGGNLTSEPAVAKNADGRLEVAARLADGNLHHTWEQGVGGSWAGWTPFAPLQATSAPALAANQDGRLEVIVRGPDLYLYHAWQTSVNGGWSGWWRYGSETVTSAPVVVREPSGRLLVFARGAFGTIIYYRQSTPSGSWDSARWVGTTEMSSPPAVAVDAYGRVNVFARGRDKTILRARQDVSGSVNYTGWGSLGGAHTSAPSVGRNADGRLEVFTRGNDEAIWSTYETSAGGGWSGWYSHGGQLSSGATVVSGADDRMEIFTRGKNFIGVNQQWQVAPNGGWSTWWTPAGWLRFLPMP